MKNKLCCPNCGSFELGLEREILRGIAIDKDGECILSEVILEIDYIKDLSASNMIICSNCEREFKYLDDALFPWVDYTKSKSWRQKIKDILSNEIH